MIAHSLYRGIGDTLKPGTTNTVSGKPIKMLKAWKVYSGYTFQQAKKHALGAIHKEFPTNHIHAFSLQSYGKEDCISWLILGPNTGEYIELFTLRTAILEE